MYFYSKFYSVKREEANCASSCSSDERQFYLFIVTFFFLLFLVKAESHPITIHLSNNLIVSVNAISPQAVSTYFKICKFFATAAEQTATIIKYTIFTFPGTQLPQIQY